MFEFDIGELYELYFGPFEAIFVAAGRVGCEGTKSIALKHDLLSRQDRLAPRTMRLQRLA